MIISYTILKMEICTPIIEKRIKCYVSFIRIFISMHIKPNFFIVIELLLPYF